MCSLKLQLFWLALCILCALHIGALTWLTVFLMALEQFVLRAAYRRDYEWGRNFGERASRLKNGWLCADVNLHDNLDVVLTVAAASTHRRDHLQSWPSICWYVRNIFQEDCCMRVCTNVNILILIKHSGFYHCRLGLSGACKLSCGQLIKY